MNDTQTIKDRVDIVQLIGEYIQLKKAGSNWKAPCPFHNEKSPSFMVHADKQIWHCFGCGKGGDIFTFIQEMEGLDFVEALKLLAKRAGVQLETYRSETDTSQRNRLLEINSKAADFFHQILLQFPASKDAREYLEKRKLKKETVAEWQIGYAPDQWDLLTKYFTKKGYGINDLVATGLTIKREGADAASGRGYYDRFRGRIMFPIWDAHGNVVGFTGRILVETENSGGKYVNTPETPLYDKSRVLYGLNKAKQEIKAKDLAVLVEGQMDVIASHQAGMKNVIAASGTALTPEQVKLIKRYTANVAMAFDADQAGINAGKRGIEVALQEGLFVKVIQIPDGFAKDADECIKKDPAIWMSAVANAESIMSWYIKITLAKYNLKIPDQKSKAAAEVLAQLAHIPSVVERDEWLKKVSVELGVETSILRDELRKRLASKGVGSPGVLAAPLKITLPQSSHELLVQEFWSLIVKYPELYHNVRAEMNPSFFDGTGIGGLYEKAESIYTIQSKLTFEELRSGYESAGTENPVDVLLLRPYRNIVELTMLVAQQEALGILKRLKEEWKKTRRKELQLAIEEAEQRKDADAVNKLIYEIQSL